MNFLIISHTTHYKVDSQIFAYAPYVREMNLWLKYVDNIQIIAPLDSDFEAPINLAYEHDNISLTEVQAFSLLGIKEQLQALSKLPKILSRLYKAMKQADHIHLRCPGNMGLLGCLVQILFPKTPKTAKYAGNWDPKAKQPWSYNLQKWILKNTWLTKNIKVLVYGEWPDQSQNILSFFTASYHESENQDIYIRDYTQKLKFCFVGSLSKGKQPGKAFELIYQLRQQNIQAELHIYGDGDLRSKLEDLISQHQAESWVKLYGNQPQLVIKRAYKYNHFLILPSQSEGWPKAVAEAMFWGCIPVAPNISCVPWMLDHGKRGILMKKNDLKSDVHNINSLINSPETLESMSTKAAEWSRQYTLDKFEEEIRVLL